MQDILNQLPNTATEWFDYFIIFVLFRSVFSKWLAGLVTDKLLKPVGKWIVKRLVRTERDLAIWLHYRNKAMRKGHVHDSPLECNDGRCLLI